ncbi:MAG: hypothetical protein OXI82_03270 [Nitrospinae bacterium]|nr:hypothetical protein [Nitrospinota bacterium]
MQFVDDILEIEPAVCITMHTGGDVFDVELENADTLVNQSRWIQQYFNIVESNEGFIALYPTFFCLPVDDDSTRLDLEQSQFQPLDGDFSPKDFPPFSLRDSDYLIGRKKNLHGNDHYDNQNKTYAGNPNQPFQKSIHRGPIAANKKAAHGS